MLVPRIEIKRDKLIHNARKLTALYGSEGIHIMAVTKEVCGSLRIAHALLNSELRQIVLRREHTFDKPQPPFA